MKKNSVNHKKDNRNKDQDLLLQAFGEYRKKIITKKNFESKWEDMKIRYPQINLYKCNFSSIGETVERLFNILDDFGRENDDLTLNLVLPSFYENYHGDLCNRRLLDIFGSRIQFINDENVDFWIYVIKNHIDDINIKEINRYDDKKLGLINVQMGKCKIAFSRDHIIEAERKMSKIGLDRDFVCILAREIRHKEICFNKEKAKEFSAYTCSINAFRKASKYLYDQNMQVVRMGKYENEPCGLENVIDYANDYYDELLDFYLVSKCKFIVDSSGFGFIAGFWGKPLLAINVYLLNYGYESLPVTGYEMIIPQKLWSERKNRYLNLTEIMDVVNVCDINLSNYEKRGIRFEKNSEDELYKAVVEMNQRLDGVWQESEEEQEAVKKFEQILNAWKEKHDFVWARRKVRWKGYQICPYRICWSYLKENMYLLDC